MPKELLDVLGDKFTVGDGCWIWTGNRDQHGYGIITMLSDRGGGHRRPFKAHRVMYELLVGPIPDGLELDHLCRVASCIRPAHLEPVTHAENVRRGLGNGYKRKTHCPKGHPYDEANTYHVTSGHPQRRCKTCAADWQRAKRARRRREQQ